MTHEMTVHERTWCWCFNHRTLRCRVVYQIAASPSFRDICEIIPIRNTCFVVVADQPRIIIFTIIIQFASGNCSTVAQWITLCLRCAKHGYDGRHNHTIVVALIYVWLTKDKILHGSDTYTILGGGVSLGHAQELNITVCADFGRYVAS